MNVYVKQKQTHIEDKFVVTKGKREVANQGYGINKYKLLCIKQISNKDILYSTRNYSLYPSKL